MIIEIKIFIKKQIENVDKILINFLSKTEFGSSLYYFAFSKQFRREHQSVLKGRISYHENQNVQIESSPLLRRNIHRLEKGLIMRPRKPIFAEAYIEATVAALLRFLDSSLCNQSELRWAFDVLDKYFNTVSDSKTIIKSRTNFELAKHICFERKCLETSATLGSFFGQESEKYSPYSKSDSIKSQISYEQLIALAKQRRSTRWFEEQAVDINLIYQAIDLASLAPSACNRQPYRFISTAKKSMATEILKCANGTAGFAENVPAAIVVVGDLSNYPLERDRHLIYIDSSLASMQLMLGIETLGLSSCPINWPDIEVNEKKIESLLSLDKNERVIMLIAVGFALPEGGIPYSQKKDNSSLNSEI